MTPVVTDVIQHTGLYAAMLGQPIQLAPPVTLFGGEGYVWGLSLAADENGILHAMWLNVIQAGYSEIRTAYYASRQNDGTWSAPQNVSNYTHQTTPSRIAVDRNGTVHTVWGGEGSPDIYYASRGSDGLWSERQIVFSSSDSNWVRTVQFVVGDTGTIDMVWNSCDSYTRCHIDYTHRMNNGTWLMPQKISGALSEESPQLAVDKTGGVHVVWQQEMPSNHGFDVYYTYRDHNGIWSEPRNICNTSGTSGYSPQDVPQLVVGADGIVHVAWLDDTPGNLDIYYVQRREDGTWSDIQNISDSPGTSTGPLLVVDNQGIPHIVWEDDTTGNVEIYYSKRGSNGTWTSPSGISNIPHSSYFGGLNLVVKNEAIHVVWTQHDESSYEFFIAYTKQDRTGNWTTPQYFARDWNGKFPLMIAGMNEEIHIAWEQEAQIGYIGPSLAEQSDDSTIAQTVTIPVTMSAPNLSLLYQLRNANPVNGTHFGVKVDNGIAATSLFSSATNTVEWSHRWFDLTPWAGQTITLSFSIHQTAGYPTAWAYLDEVTIGSAYPDLWVEKDSNAVVLPGEQVVYRITYGNQGGAPASGVRITDTMPSGLLFVDSDPPPRWGSTMLWMWPWDVGDLPAQSGPRHIVVTATVSPSATMFSSFTNTVSIGSASAELETVNNTAHAAVFVGIRTYLPLVMREYF